MEAQRLGLEAHGSDLNPVAVLISKALFEIPPKFAGCAPVNPEGTRSLMDRDWHRGQRLADDIRYYGKWMRDEAERRIGHLYPKVTLPKEYGGGEATIIAWLWARAVTCSNPACRASMPLISKYWLSNSKGRQTWIEPIVSDNNETVSFAIRTGVTEADHAKEIGMGTCFVGNRGKKVKALFKCIICQTGIANGDYIDTEANKGLMGVVPLAIVAAGKQGRIYLPFDTIQVQVALEQSITLLSNSRHFMKLPTQPARGTFASNAQGRIYGFKTFADYFTSRQLIALSTFSDLIQEAKQRVLADANVAGMPQDNVSLNDADVGETAYADAVATYLAIAIDRLADRNSTICSWDVTRDSTRNTFARQAIQMVWDFAEANPFSESTGNFQGAIEWVVEVIQESSCNAPGEMRQQDATDIANDIKYPLISTDPPYYDNIGYADLSDFFYVWLRRSLNNIYPDLFSTMLVPKSQELVATPYRFNGSKGKAQEFFEHGLAEAFEQMRTIQNPEFPLTVYYAFKQSESGVDNNEDAHTLFATASTGWETMLEGLISAGFSITGTWPIRTEMMNRSVGQGTNALASSIVLVCRPRPVDAPIASRREFLNAL